MCDILDPSTAIGRTTQQALNAGKSKSTQGYMFYNDGAAPGDEPDVSKDGSQWAHAKGIVSGFMNSFLHIYVYII